MNPGAVAVPGGFADVGVKFGAGTVAGSQWAVRLWVCLAGVVVSGDGGGGAVCEAYCSGDCYGDFWHLDDDLAQWLLLA